ncbi:MAG: pitrilysin family protein [Pseudomonadota bacterium]
MRRARLTLLLAAAAFISACQTAPVDEAPAVDTGAGSLNLPVHYHRLDNGLRVVISEDRSVPVATVAVYYQIGFRIEPRDRTGFAHLFEHMMFQGTPNLGKNGYATLVQSNGGTMNGSTRFDFTNYFAAVPSHKVETMLWAEADRMRALSITGENLKNQQEVVKNEVRVNVLNRPYGGFPWLDMPQYANENWYNAHNFYGDLEDVDAATVEEMQAFFDTYYAPNNAVVVVAGDVEPDGTLKLIERYFGNLEPAPQGPEADISEPPQTAEKRFSKVDPLAPRPALGLAYHMPERGSPEYFAMILLDMILLQGDDSRLTRSLVKTHGYAQSVFGGINILGNAYNYNGPMLWTAALIHDPQVPADRIVGTLDEEIQRIIDDGVTDAELARARTKMRSGLYDLAGSATRFGLVDLLAVFALFDDDPSRINRLEGEFSSVTPELVRETAANFLVPTNRTILTVLPADQPTDQPTDQGDSS